MRKKERKKELKKPNFKLSSSNLKFKKMSSEKMSIKFLPRIFSKTLKLKSLTEFILDMKLKKLITNSLKDTNISRDRMKDKNMKDKSSMDN